jgi:uncharacterized membrane protein
MAELLSMGRRNAGVRDTRSDAKRLGALITGGSIALYGLSRRSRGGIALAAAGGWLAYSGAKENIPSEIIAHSSMIINASQQEVYRFWRDFENLPRFMNHLENVKVTGERRSRWIALGPLGTRIAWDAEIISERATEEIKWRSLPGSDVEVDGVVRFRPATGNRGTLIEVISVVIPPAGELGRAVAKVFGKDPSFMMRQDLRRLKALMEAGEIPTVEGQTHGPRSAKVAALRMLDPDHPVRVGGANIKDVLTAKRRIA